MLTLIWKRGSRGQITACLDVVSPQVVRNVAQCLRPGSGRVLLRDYADADLTHDRLAAAGRRQRLAHDTFVRGDGTLCCYFTQVVGCVIRVAFLGASAYHQRRPRASVQPVPA